MKVVAYVRVSTDKQGRSGLGLEAQTAAIGSYCAAHDGEIVATFQEIESGTGSTTRPTAMRTGARRPAVPSGPPSTPPGLGPSRS